MPYKDKASRDAYKARRYEQDPDWRRKHYQTYKAKNGERIRQRDKAARFKDVPSNTPEYKLFDAARYRSKKTGKEFTIELSEIIIPEFCPVLGIPIRKLPSEHPEYNRDNSPSLDRIDNDRGYVPGNVEVISYRANTLKSNANLEELRKVLSYVDDRMASISEKKTSSVSGHHSG